MINKRKMKSVFIELLKDSNIVVDADTKKTPERMTNAWLELTEGLYRPQPNITLFENKSDFDEIVKIGDIDIVSMCSHHMMPFFGKCYIAYIPSKHIIGISKFARVVDWLSRRPQTQEHLTGRIVEIIRQTAQPKGIIVHLRCTHTCMLLRGVRQKSRLDTTASFGCLNNSIARTEFLTTI